MNIRILISVITLLSWCQPGVARDCIKALGMIPESDPVDAVVIARESSYSEIRGYHQLLATHVPEDVKIMMFLSPSGDSSEKVAQEGRMDGVIVSQIPTSSQWIRDYSPQLIRTPEGVALARFKYHC